MSFLSPNDNRPAQHGPNSFETMQTSQESAGDPNLAKPSGFRQCVRTAARSFADSFDRHPDSFNPETELTLALDKSLKAYHSQLIALGSAIGTGLFIGAGAGLAIGGPIPLLIAFSFVGFTLCPTVFALGEMATLLPLPGGFVEHCRLFTDEAWGAAMGWNYAFQWLVTLPLELVASSITLQYWGKPLGHHWVWVTIFLIGIATINVFGVKGYANAEATFSTMKVVAVAGFIIFGMLLDVGLGFNGQAIGTEHWYRPGAANNGFLGFCGVIVIAAFAYSGSEIVGITAAEQENPRRDMPRAIRKVFWRIGIFYIASIFLIGLIVPYNDPHLIMNVSSLNSAASPFVIAIKNAGVRVLPSMINAVILITVLSVANSSIYGSSRVLNAMADAGIAPKAFAYIDTMGRPLRCFYLSFAFGLLAYLAQLPQENTAFIWLLALCGLSSIISWTSICFTHLRFRQALRLQNWPVQNLPFRSPFGVTGSWVGLICNLLIIVLQLITAIKPIGYEQMSNSERAQSFFQSFMAFPLIFLFYLGFKFLKGTQLSGVYFDRRRVLRFENPHIEWGEGTTVANLREIDLSEAWTLDDYNRDAQINPQLLVVEELWWCPKPLREPLRACYFPWR